MIILIGDVHGEFKELTAKLERSNVRESYFIQVGDFGLGFKKKEVESDELEVLNSFLITGNNHLYVIRGNHDNPKYFKAPSGLSNITFLADYSLLELEGQTILLAGGAISIDRMARVLDVSYWPGEAFGYDETLLEKRIKGVTKIDIVVTHNAPEKFYPTELADIVVAYALRDGPLLWEIKKDRYRHSQLLDFLIHKKLKPKFWYYGHFHSSYSDKHKGIKYRVLDCSEFFEHKGKSIASTPFLDEAFSLSENRKIQLNDVPNILRKDLMNFMYGSTVEKNEGDIVIFQKDYLAWLEKLKSEGPDYEIRQ